MAEVGEVPIESGVKVLGVDPGLRITGYGCVEGAVDPPELVEAGVFNLARGSGKGSLSERLLELDRDFRALLARLKPDAVAVESIFAHYRHPATAITMGHARGVLLLAVRAANIPLLEYKPNEIKKSLTGNGHASKEQIQAAVRDLFRLPEPPRPADMADALAVATCASWRVCSVGPASVR